MRAVNLLPDELRPGSPWATIGKRASARHVLGGSGAAAVVLALAIAGLVVHERGVVDDRRSELRGAEARLVAAEAKADAVRQAQASNAARLAAVRDVVTRRVVWEDVLLDVARVRPDNVSFQSLSATVAPTAAAGAPATPAAGPAGFTLTGAADSQRRVAQVLDRLALLPWLSNVTLQQSMGGSGSTTTPVQFTIGAAFSSTGGRP